MSNPTPIHPTPNAGKIKLDKPVTETKAAAARQSLSEEQRRVMIAEAAYYAAEQRGFESGHELDDWLLAESQIEAAIRGGEPAAA